MRLLAPIEVALGHVGHMGLVVLGPGLHARRPLHLLLGHLLDRLGAPPVGVSLPQHGVHGASEDLAVPRLDLFTLLCCWVLVVVRDLGKFSRISHRNIFECTEATTCNLSWAVLSAQL